MTGDAETDTVNQLPAYQARFASLTLHEYDRVRLLEFPPDTYPVIRSAILNTWTRGIKDERFNAGGYEFKLHGNPWFVSDNEMPARRVTQQILANLWNAGWIMSLNTNFSRRKSDMDMMIFRYHSPPPAPCDWMSISFCSGDRLRLIDAPSDVLTAIVAQLQPLTKESKEYAKMPGTWELKLRGWPWVAMGDEQTAVRWMLLHLMSLLDRFGFTVYASINQRSTKPDDHNEPDLWHCRRLRSQTPISPIRQN